MLPSYMYRELDLINRMVDTAIKHGNNWSREKELKNILQEYIDEHNLNDFCKVSGSKVNIKIEEI